jgi:hypothetical protein
MNYDAYVASKKTVSVPVLAPNRGEGRPRKDDKGVLGALATSPRVLLARDLIKMLKELPGALPVYVSPDGWGQWEIVKVETEAACAAHLICLPMFRTSAELQETATRGRLLSPLFA